MIRRLSVDYPSRSAPAKIARNPRFEPITDQLNYMLERITQKYLCVMVPRPTLGIKYLYLFTQPFQISFLYDFCKNLKA